MNEVTKQIMFGAQKQANRVNDALVIFVEDYLTNTGNCQLPGMSDGDTVSPQSWIDCKILEIESALWDVNQKMVKQEPVTVADVTFAKLFLGLQEMSKLGPGCHFNHECVSDTGKYVFFAVPGVEGQMPDPEAKPDGNTAEVIAQQRRTASKEQEAMSLIEEILKNCPNRGDYPEDDALAAIMYGKEYWKEAR